MASWEERCAQKERGNGKREVQNIKVGQLHKEVEPYCIGGCLDDVVAGYW
jgi:hypothetical protein